MNIVPRRNILAFCAIFGIFIHADRSYAQATTEPRPAAVARLYECQSVVESDARAHCYDQAVESLKVAEREGTVVIVERERILEARRALFGFTLPAFPSLMGGGATEQMDAIETTLNRASFVNGAGWTFQLSDGSTWRQIDDFPLQFRPVEGMPVRVRRAAMGSYFLKVANNPAVRAKRQ